MPRKPAKKGSAKRAAPAPKAAPAKKAPPPAPAFEVEIAVGAPIGPHGLTFCARVPFADVERATAGLVAKLRAAHDGLRLTEEERPRADHVPGGTPLYIADEDGGARLDRPRRVGF
jgi:hypothetical protein